MLTTIVCLILLDGINTKTIAAMIGTILGTLLAGGFSFIAGILAHITGFNTGEAEALLLIASNTKLTIRGLLVASILISSLGAVMDIAVSIASAIDELHKVKPKLKSKDLFNSGMNIGKDMMGTMANTLILAFTGSSLNLLLIIFSYGIPFYQLINTDLIAIEVLKAIGSSIGIILTVPIVAFVSSRIVIKSDNIKIKHVAR
jgi:uncharacterized membrane protein